MSLSHPAGVGRRTVLLGGLATLATMSGCSILNNDKPAIVDNSPALLPVLNSALAQKAAYQAAIDNGAPGTATLEMVRDNHSAHAETLQRILGGTEEVATTSTADVTGDPLTALSEAETTAYEESLESAVSVTPELAVLLGEIAACRASHVDVLEELR